MPPRGKSFWNARIENINWRRAWLIPFKFCITNKAKDVHFKILHKIYPTNSSVAKYTDVENKCTFCKNTSETFSHLFLDCEVSRKPWRGIESHFLSAANCVYSLTSRDIIYYYDNKKNAALENVLNFIILYAKFFIHKQKFSKSLPKFSLFQLELKSLMKSYALINSKKMY